MKYLVLSHSCYLSLCVKFCKHVCIHWVGGTWRIRNGRWCGSREINSVCSKFCILAISFSHTLPCLYTDFPVVRSFNIFMSISATFTSVFIYYSYINMPAVFFMSMHAHFHTFLSENLSLKIKCELHFLLFSFIFVFYFLAAIRTS